MNIKTVDMAGQWNERTLNKRIIAPDITFCSKGEMIMTSQTFECSIKVHFQFRWVMELSSTFDHELCLEIEPQVEWLQRPSVDSNYHTIECTDIEHWTLFRIIWLIQAWSLHWSIGLMLYIHNRF